ncbi:MAG: FAD binding domain-containing protein [Acidobacteriota bacterium]
MYPAPFDYYRADSIDHALELLGAHDDAKVLAGGHSLLPMMKLRLAQPETLIDIGRIDALRGVRFEGDTVTVGALTTHHELASSDVLRGKSPLLAAAAAQIADPAVRNFGTLGGNIAHADPASDLPAVLVALDARISIRGTSSERTVDAGDFFVGLLETAVEEGELLLSVELPTTGTGVAYAKSEQQASGYAVCGAAAVLDGERTNLAFNGVAATPVDARDAAKVFADGGDEAAVNAAIRAALDGHDLLDDLFASGDFRGHLATVYGRRALAAARAAG